MIKYPEIEVKLTDHDGNAFAIIGTMIRALRKSDDVSKGDIDEFMTEAQSGDYDHLLQTCMKWVTIN